MAEIKGIKLKNVRNTEGREGYGLIAEVWLGNKKVGEFADYADGAMGDMTFTSKEMEEKFVHIVMAYGKDHPDQFIMNLHKERPEQYQSEVERLKDIYPFLSDEEITEESVSACDYDFIINDLADLINLEKSFRKGLKQGYSCLYTTSDGKVYVCTEKVLRKAVENKEADRFFKSLEDFIIK